MAEAADVLTVNNIGSIKIRPATKDDLDDVIAINMECLPEHYPYSFWLEYLERWEDLFYVAEVGGKIVGYILSRLDEGKMVCKKREGRIGHIVSVAVKEEYRGRGIATALMSAVIAVLRSVYNAEEVHLEVRVSNYKAIRLYEKLNFIKAYIIKNYYIDGEDAYLMVKSISDEPCRINPIA